MFSVINFVVLVPLSGNFSSWWPKGFEEILTQHEAHELGRERSCVGTCLLSLNDLLKEFDLDVCSTNSNTWLDSFVRRKVIDALGAVDDYRAVLDSFVLCKVYGMSPLYCYKVLEFSWVSTDFFGSRNIQH